MPSFTIKGLPEPLLRRLKTRAERNRRSVNSEILVCLEQALSTAPADPAEVLARADALRAGWGRRPRLSDAALRAAKNAGRP